MGFGEAGTVEEVGTVVLEVERLILLGGGGRTFVAENVFLG